MLEPSSALWDEQKLGCIDQRPDGVFESLAPIGFQPTTRRRTMAKPSGLAKPNFGRFGMQDGSPSLRQARESASRPAPALQDSLIETHAEQAGESISLLVRW